MEKSRYFNTIEIVDDYTIKKSSKDKLKLKAEFEWYKNNTLFDVPNIYSYWEENDIASYTIHLLQDIFFMEIFPIMQLDTYFKIYMTAVLKTIPIN